MGLCDYYCPLWGAFLGELVGLGVGRGYPLEADDVQVLGLIVEAVTGWI